MNNQPPLLAGQLLGLALVLGYMYYFFKAKVEAELRNNISDGPMFTIGRVIEEPLYEQDFYDDCKNSLVSVGYKKSYANRITKQVFEKNIPSDITSFLSRAMKEQHVK